MGENEKRNKVVLIRLTPKERELLRHRSTSAGLTMSEFIRRSVFRHKLTLRVPPVNRTIYEKLAPTASNLNQIARHLNLGRLLDADSLAPILARLRSDLAALRSDLIEGRNHDR